jgi:integrase
MHSSTKLVKDAELWFRALVECAAFIGWRHEELLGLRVRQVYLEHRILRLEPGTTKNGEGREAPMTDRMQQLLTACCEGKGPQDAVFSWSDGKPVIDFRDRWYKPAVPLAWARCTASSATRLLPTKSCHRAQPVDENSPANSRATRVSCFTTFVALPPAT